MGINKWFHSFIFGICFCVLSSCEGGVRSRPIGFYRLGNIYELSKSPETYFKDYNLFLRHDERGLFIMSTICTYDLSPLRRNTGKEEDFWESELTTSTYTLDGKVLNGPAKGDLPYYKLHLDAKDYGGTKNYLYAQVGIEKPKEWRFAVPSENGGTSN